MNDEGKKGASRRVVELNHMKEVKILKTSPG